MDLKFLNLFYAIAGLVEESGILMRRFFPHLGLSLSELRQLNNDEYAIRVLGTFCKTALEQKSFRALYVDYDYIVDLPGTLERYGN